MKAAYLHTFQDLRMMEIEKPVPGPNEALVKVIYGGVCGSDITVYRGLHPTATAPVVLCHEILGKIEQLPAGYQGPFQIGERVLMNPVVSCGHCGACKGGQENVCTTLKLLGIHENGGFAEYTKVDVARLVKTDPALSDELAALGEPFAVGYHVNARAGLQKGDTALVIGAGTIGLVVSMVAKALGGRVVIAEMNQSRLQDAKDYGFETIDVNKGDLTQQAKELLPEGFDIVYEASGSKSGVMALPDLCRAGGKILSLGLSGAPYEFPIGKVSFKELTLIGTRLYSQEDFEAGVRLLSEIANLYDLSKMIAGVSPLSGVQAAIDKMMSGTCDGKILIDPQG